MINFFKENKMKIIISSLLTLSPIIVGLLLWDKLPEAMPIHWNAKGEVDDYASKAFAVFGMPFFLLLVNLLCVFSPKLDTRNNNQNKKVISIIFILAPLLSIFVSAASYAAALNYTFPPFKILNILFAVLFFVTGNYLPKCKHNKTIGIRIPTTLKSEENWDKTHFFAGKVWVGCSVLMLLSTFLPETISYCVIAVLVLIIALAPIIYSIAISRKTK